MNLLDAARAQVDFRSLILMTVIEKLRHTGVPAHATAVAAHIKGAPIAEVDKVLSHLADDVQVLDRVYYLRGDRKPRSYAVNPLGAELLNAEIDGWKPSDREQTRRDSTMKSAQVGRVIEP